ncbi:MAG: hypothetical protein JWM99_4991 [Verrucomicrobiales bacterium]|nr:hypothetical protein [Verrucomicrobiales bacterium]
MEPQLDRIQGDSGILTVKVLEFALRIVLRAQIRDPWSRPGRMADWLSV